MSLSPEILDSRIETLRQSFLDDSPFREDRAAVEELMIEARPVIDALSAPGDHPEGRTHEALAMVALLGRRAAGLGLSPTAMHALFSGLVDQMEPADARMRREVFCLGLEGFVSERGDMGKEMGRALAQRAVPIVELVPSVFAVFLHGHHEAEQISELTEALGKRMLHGGALSVLFDATGFENPTPEIASEIFAADATAAMLGVPCVFAVTPRLVELLPEVSSVHERVMVETSTRRGLKRALQEAGYVLRDGSSWPALLRRLLDEDR
jgi:hypothetical protein